MFGNVIDVTGVGAIVIPSPAGEIYEIRFIEWIVFFSKESMNRSIPKETVSYIWDSNGHVIIF